MSKSYWQSVMVDGPRSQTSIKSWFGLMVDQGDVVTSADILCDKVTDREKKIRAFVTAANGSRFKFERTLGGKTFSIKRTCIARAPEITDTGRDGCAGRSPEPQE